MVVFCLKFAPINWKLTNKKPSQSSVCFPFPIDIKHQCSTKSLMLKFQWKSPKMDCSRLWRFWDHHGHKKIFKKSRWAQKTNSIWFIVWCFKTFAPIRRVWPRQVLNLYNCKTVFTKTSVLGPSAFIWWFYQQNVRDLLEIRCQQGWWACHPSQFRCDYGTRCGQRNRTAVHITFLNLSFSF